MSNSKNVPASSPVFINLLEGIELRTAREWHFNDQEIIKVGRSRESDVCLSHPKVSRCHIVVFVEDGIWNVSAPGSNGTFLDGEQIEHIALPDSGVTLQLAENGPVIEIGPNEQQAAGDVTMWINQMQGGDSAAAEQLYEVYFPRIVNLARKRLDGRTRRVTDEEDVAVVVLESLFRGIVDGRYPELTSSDSLWRLLVVMTARRAINDVQAQRAQKRGHGQVRGESVFYSPGADSTAGIDQFAVEAEAPQFVEQLTEQLMSVLTDLGDDNLKQLVILKLEGFTNAEIAEKMEVSERTIERKLNRLREHVGKEADDD